MILECGYMVEHVYRTPSLTDQGVLVLTS